MRKYLFLLVSFVIVACNTSTPPPTETQPMNAPSASPTQIPTSVSETISLLSDFVFQGEDPSIPIITNQPSPEIQNKYINPGAVIFHEGQFHMFFNSFTAWPGKILVGYAISDDGYNWEMAQPEPVFTTDQIPYDNGKGDVSSVLVTDDGTWVMYFHTNGGGKQQLGRATALSPLGPWIVDPEPILSPGSEGSWDEKNIFWPSVIRDENGYRMYYGAQNSSLQGSIGMATSQDGFKWIKNENPVLLPEEDWETTKVDRPRVQHTPDGWIMIYQGGAAVENRGLAVSADGISWSKYYQNPFITQESFPIEFARTWDTSLLYYDRTYYYFMEIGTLSGTNLFLATHDGLLK